jgi:uncharacterized RDD family membrane protein YckC
MKCPKCGYLGFEPVDRCRNCGYDFSFAPPATTPDLSIRFADAEDVQPLADLPLANSTPAEPDEVDDALRAGTVPGTAPREQLRPPGGRRVLSEPLERGLRSDRNRDVAADLPLFGTPPDDVPLITRASPPRQPLSVRRATPEIPRQRTEPRPASPASNPMLDLEATGGDARFIEPTPSSHYRRAVRSSSGRDAITPEAAGVAARVLAVIVDVLILAVLDLAVIYFTLKICGLTPDDIGILPKGPLIAFLVVQNGGYLVVFTAGGQTLGKLMAGIRVVSSEPGGSVDLGHSAVRTLVWALLAMPAGLGFVTALFNRDRRGLHDRCAGTRVVRAAA